jgi:tRNA nucleotidyltransferase (CCA-adding enzyme)
MQNVPANRVMRFTALFHDVAKPKVKWIDEKNGRTHFKGHALEGSIMVGKILRRLRVDNKTIKTVSRLIACHDDRPADKGMTPENIRRSVHKIGKDIYEQYLQIAYADFQGKSDYGKEKGFDGYLYACEQFKYIMENEICTSVAEMKISGKILIEMGCPTGSIIGDILDELLDMVLADPAKNTEEYLRIEAGKLIKKFVDIEE